MTQIIDEDCYNIVKLAPCDWNKLRGKRIFLTGGTGFFGKWFLHSFLHINRKLRLDATMVVLSRSPQKFLKAYPYFMNNKELSYIQGDVRDFIFPLDTFDIMIHAATPASAKLEAENPTEMYSIIVDGTKHTLEFAKKSGVKRIILISSGAIYGPQPPELGHIAGTFPPQPVTAYGRGKYEAEKLCLSSGIDSVIARCFAFVGPYLPMNIHYAIGNFISDALNGRNITVKGDGRPYRSYLYAADLMIWLWTILLAGQTGEAYNVGSEVEVSIAELAHTVSRCVDPSIGVRTLGKVDPVIPAPRYVPSTGKARKELKLDLHYNLETSIRRTAEWAQEV